MTVASSLINGHQRHCERHKQSGGELTAERRGRKNARRLLSAVADAVDVPGWMCVNPRFV